jgi:hypothetical protein
MSFLKVTTYEKKIGLLLIETFRKLIDAQIYGHLETGGHILICRMKLGFLATLQHHIV